MYDCISPYALLCQSKPKQTPTFVTAYDLYSRAGQSGVHAAPPETSSAAIPNIPPEPVSPEKPASFKHTHYISDIQTRHRAAGKNAVFSNAPLK